MPITAIIRGGQYGDAFVDNSVAGLSYGDVVILDTSADRYVDTTTAEGDTKVCGVVIDEMDENGYVRVASTGLVDVSVTGSVSRGDWLKASTTAGAAKAVSEYEKGCFAIAVQTGEDELVKALLLPAVAALIVKTASLDNDAVTAAKIDPTASWGASSQKLLNLVPFTSANEVLRIVSMSDSDFMATIAAAGTSGDKVYHGAPSSGAVANITPNSPTELGKIVLHNTTRSEEALIVATGADGTGDYIQITNSADIASWQAGDTITTRSQTNDSGPPYFYDVDLSDTLAATTHAILTQIYFNDTGGVGRCDTHPFESFSTSKNFRITNFSADNPNRTDVFVPITSQRFCIRTWASGANTATVIIKIKRYDEEAAT